jgi:hypothetical protein
MMGEEETEYFPEHIVPVDLKKQSKTKIKLMSWTYSVNKLLICFWNSEDEEQHPDPIRLFANPVASA